MTSDYRIDLPADGHCPCGCDRLLLAEDMIRYTPYTKDPEHGWIDEGSSLEAMDNDDPTGNVRLFCPACGQYFFIPEDMP